MKKRETIILGLFVAVIALLVWNQYQLNTITLASIPGGPPSLPTGRAAVSDVIPTGVPRLYGDELGIRYEDVNPDNPGIADQTINVLANLDRTIQLEGQDLERYVSIVSQISCEYCCGAKAIIVDEQDVARMEQQIQAAIASGRITEADAGKYRKRAGDAACGCAHSYAMRGLAKYILTNHGSEFSDDEVLTELAKWKTLFFPAQMTAKAEVLKEKGIPFSYINLGSNKYRGIEQGTATGGMVGGC